MNWNYVLWDWNGTIIDDLVYNFNIVNTLLLEKCLAPISLEEYRKKFCFPIKKFYDEIGLKCNTSEYEVIANKYQILYESKIKEIELSYRIKELMAFLHEINIKQFLFTSSNKSTLMTQLALYTGIVPLIDGIICQNNNLGIGKAELFYRWKMEQGIIDCSSIVIIGDTYYERDIATNFGADSILIKSGHQNVNETDDHLVFDSIAHLESHKSLFL